MCISRLAAADDADLAHAADVLELLLDPLAGDLRDVAQGRGARNDDLQDGRGVGIEFLNDRRLGRFRQVAQNEIDLVADFLRGDVAVLIEQEADDDLRYAFDWKWSEGRQCR